MDIRGVQSILETAPAMIALAIVELVSAVLLAMIVLVYPEPWAISVLVSVVMLIGFCLWACYLNLESALMLYDITFGYPARRYDPVPKLRWVFIPLTALWDLNDLYMHARHLENTYFRVSRRRRHSDV